MPLLTAEQSRLGAIKSVEARRANKAELKALRVKVAQYEELLAVKASLLPKEEYACQVLSRVRTQLDLLLTRLEEETARKVPDPQDIDKLASALQRVSEIERQLAGRPLPGSLKPSSKPQRAGPTPFLGQNLP